MNKRLGMTYLWSLLFSVIAQIFFWGVFIFFDESKIISQDLAEGLACLSSIVLLFVSIILILIFEKKITKKLNVNPLPLYIFFTINWGVFSILGGLFTLKLVDIGILHYCDSSAGGSLFGPCFLNGIEYIFESIIMILAIVLLIVLRLIILFIKFIKSNKEKVRKTLKENTGMVVLMVSIIIISIVFFIIKSFDLDEKYHLNHMIKNGDEFITYDESTIVVHGIKGTKFTKSTIMLDYDSKTVGFLMANSFDEFMVYKLKEGNCVSESRYLQREFELNRPGISFKTYYSNEENSHRTTDLLLVMDDNKMYSACNIKDEDGDYEPFLDLN